MKSIIFYFSVTATLFCSVANAQSYRRFSKKELIEDVAFLKQQLFNVHANPFTEIDKEKYERLFLEINAKLRDSLTSAELYTLVRPSLAYLSDEHAEIRLPNFFMENDLFLPFNLVKIKESYVIDTVFGKSPKIKKGDQITTINNVPIPAVLKNLEKYSSGFPAQRTDQASQLFGYLYSLAYAPRANYLLTFSNNEQVNVNAIPFQPWYDYLKSINGVSNSKERISYRQYKQVGYINAVSFGVRGDEDFKRYASKIDSIFQEVKKDKIQQLVIDVSENSGGNSAIGDLLINGFYSKTYKSYQVNWKRSDEYLKVLKSYGDEDANYEKLKPGETLHYDPSLVTPLAGQNKFSGKVYIVIGNGTFSSAMMFATTIKDNKIATLIGESPKNGHPSHFGEQYSFKLPNTQLSVRFGVKEWIRPAGKGVKNILVPDVQTDPKNLPEILKLVAGKGN